MKVKIKHTYLLVCCVAILAILCFASIYQPISFKHQQIKREVAVKQYLIKIRAAQEKYHSKMGYYTASFDTLTQKGYLPDSIQYIPYANKKKFLLQTSVQLSKSGKQITLMECSAAYTDFLYNLNTQRVQQLVENEQAAGRYPGLKIGNLITPNNNAGNWE